MHREMQEMKSQLAELKQMMRVSFDLQMDIQRSIRQEVAAALSMFLASPPQAVVLQGSPGLQNTATASLHTCPIPTLGKLTYRKTAAYHYTHDIVPFPPSVSLLIGQLQHHYTHVPFPLSVSSLGT